MSQAGSGDPGATSGVRWLITGAGGQVGHDLLAVLAERDEPDVLGFTRAELDVTDAAAVGKVVDDAAADGTPLVVINAAAYTAVDAAETDEAAAYAGNTLAPGHLADALGDRGRLIHISTDYVFDGDATAPYPVDAPTEPRTVYGRTKLDGERAVLERAARGYVVRTAWVYGVHGGNFVKTMIRLAGERDTLSVVDDQRGSPTWSRHLAEGLVALADSDAEPGTYHATGSGDTTWFGLTRAIFEDLGLDPERVQPTTTEAFPRPAPRPAYSVLSDAEWVRAGLAPLPHWRPALTAALAQIAPRDS